MKHTHRVLLHAQCYAGIIAFACMVGATLIWVKACMVHVPQPQQVAEPAFIMDHSIGRMAQWDDEAYNATFNPQPK